MHALLCYTSVSCKKPVIFLATRTSQFCTQKSFDIQMESLCWWTRLRTTGYEPLGPPNSFTPAVTAMILRFRKQ